MEKKLNKTIQCKVLCKKVLKHKKQLPVKFI